MSLTEVIGTLTPEKGHPSADESSDEGTFYFEPTPESILQYYNLGAKRSAVDQADVS